MRLSRSAMESKGIPPAKLFKLRDYLEDYSHFVRRVKASARTGPRPIILENLAEGCRFSLGPFDHKVNARE